MAALKFIHSDRVLAQAIVGVQLSICLTAELPTIAIQLTSHSEDAMTGARGKSTVLVVAIVIWFPNNLATVLGQPDPCTSVDCQVPLDPLGDPLHAGPVVPIGESCNVANPTSKCWGRSYGNSLVPNNGFPLNIALHAPFGPGDYPPVKTDPSLSSSPLVSRESAHFNGQSPFRERPVHNDIIDLVTGQPLLQETDFELKFGGAVFRHIRTYSENSSAVGAGAFFVDNAATNPQGTFWDWNGLFWMMSESPVLLFDLSFKKLVAPGTTDTKRCYLIPDSHHAIPFIWQNDTGGGSYVAPAWFDAIMETNSPTNPTEAYIWLHHHTIKYTFKIHTEDMWNKEVTGPSVHVPPDANGGGGFGIPHYGLIDKISDRFGNRIEYNYGGFSQYDGCNYNVPPGGTDCCNECCQNCNEKGQINYIKLIDGSNTVAWTLVYTYRAFKPAPMSCVGLDWNEQGGWQDLSVLYQHMLHSIHVYEGDYDVTHSPLQGCRTISADVFCSKTTLDEIDEINAVSLFGLGSDWVTEAKYMYSEESPTGGSWPNPYCDGGGVDHAFARCQATDVFGSGAATGPCGTKVGLRLMKAAVTKRKPGGDWDTLSRSRTVYRDGIRLAASSGNPPYGYNSGCYLKAIYRDAAIDRVISALPEGSNENTLINFPYVAPLDPQGDNHTLALFGKPFKALADVFMGDWDGRDSLNGVDMSVGYPNSISEGLREFMCRQGDRVYFYPKGRQLLQDNRSDSPKNGGYVFHRFIRFASTIPNCDSGVDVGVFTGYYGGPHHHFPYRFDIGCPNQSTRVG